MHIPPSHQPQGAVGARLSTDRDRAFLGRDEEIALFRSVLAPQGPPHSVLWFHGPGGVGKSALLRRLAAEADALGLSSLSLDARRLDRNRSAYEHALGGPSWPEGLRVLFVDTAELLGPVEGWLREVLLPSAPEGALVVTAGRDKPATEWVTDPAWWRRCHAAPLRDLSARDAAALLRHRNVPAHEVPGILRFAHGHPLALVLVADVLAQRGDSGRKWEAPTTPDVVTTLVRHLVSDVPTPHHRDALAVATLARVTTDGLLTGCVPAAQDLDLFGWLQDLSFVEATEDGLVPHQTAREAFDTYLRWRDQDRYDNIFRRAYRHTSQRLAQSRDTSADAALDLWYLGRRHEVIRDFYNWEAHSSMSASRARPDEHDAIMDLVRRWEGDQTVDLAEAWWVYQPSAFISFRTAAAGVAGFMTLLTLPPELPADAPRDPLVEAALAWIRENAPVQESETVYIGRWIMDADHYQDTASPASVLASSTYTQKWRTATRLAVSIVFMANRNGWQPVFNLLGHQTLPTPMRDLANRRTYTGFFHDWRTEPADARNRAIENRLVRGSSRPEADPFTDPEAPEPAVSRSITAEAVKDAFVSFRDPAGLSTSPLLGFRCTGPEHGIDDLRELLQSTVRHMAESPDQELASVLHTTYLSRERSQQAAASQLGMSFSTYRRRLSRALARATDLIWQRETHGPDQATQQAEPPLL
ncbi:hypothetical protein ACIP79_02850 [Streptomyces sp. NPDC088747]|uniref:hypothetical protein n=1 Tax=Streptomyces sp. NPDC088747 TaxID=3365886 RepID=UPI00382C0535